MMKQIDCNSLWNDDLDTSLRLSSETGHEFDQLSTLLMRRELVDILGEERAKGMMMRVGYQAGVEAAKIARQRNCSAGEKNQFLLGMQALIGGAPVSPVNFELNIEDKLFNLEWSWDGSCGCDSVQIEIVSKQAICWLQVGYATGYSSEFTGQPIVFFESECHAAGQGRCLIVGKPMAEWPEAEQLMQYYQADKVADEVLNLRAEVGRLKLLLGEKADEPDVVKSPAFKVAGSGVYSTFVNMFFEAQNNLFDIEKTILQESVNRARGNLSRAARSLGMTRPQLAYRLRKIEKED